MADLITLDEYKTAKDITKSNQDARLEMLITNVSSLIQTYLGQNIVDDGNDIVESISLDFDTPVIYLDRYPVNQIVSVQEINPATWDSTIHYPVDPTSFTFDANNARIIRQDTRGWPTGYNSVIVTYRAGYSEVPAELKQATIDLVTYYLKEEYKVSQNMRGASLTNDSAGSRALTPADLVKFPAHIQRVLDLYKYN